MNDFIQNLYLPLFESPPIVKANIMFKMLDFDDDGYLHASDLVIAQQYIDELSDFGEELSKLAHYYIKAYLDNRGKVKLADQINIYRYKDLLDDSGGSAEKKSSSKAAVMAAAARGSKDKKEEQAAQEALDAEAFVKFRSCGIEEIKKKIMAEPEAFKDNSVFIANKANLEKAK